MAVRALVADRRWAAVAAAPTTRSPGAGPLGTAPKPNNVPNHRDSFAWGNKPVHPASDAQGASSLLSLKIDGGSGSLTNIDVRPASGGSSRSSTSGSDLLDSPLAWGQNSDPVSASNVLTLHNSAAAISGSQRTDSRSGSVQLSHFQASFSEALKAPQRSIAKQGITSHGKGFTPSADDFPVLISKFFVSESQLGGGPVPNTNFPMEAQKAQSHGTQTPNICMPPPCLDHWNPPPDHPPDRNRIWRRGAASYGPSKPGNTLGTGSLPVESLIHYGQTLLHQEGEARHGPVHSDYPENRDSCYAHVPTDSCIKSLPHLIPGKVKDSHSDSVTLEKQLVIKKDLELLEKIRLLNIKARNLPACNMSQISSCRESKAEDPKTIRVKTDQVAKDIPFHAVTNDIAAAFDLANRVSECRNLVLNGPSNVPADCVIIDLSEGHVTECSQDRNLGESADYHVQKAKSMAKPEEVNSHSYACSHKSYNVPIEANKIRRKQKAGGSVSAEHDSSAPDTCFIDYAEKLNVPLTANRVKNTAVLISSTPPAGTAGVTGGPLIHSVTPSANKTDLDMVEHIAQKSAALSNGTIVQKLLPMESRQRQVHSRDIISREMPNNAESTEHTRNVAGTLMNARRSEDKPRVDVSTKNENRRHVFPHMFYADYYSEASSVHKNHTSGVVINSSIIPVQVASVRGFTVGSIMLGDVSLASVNQEEKTAVKKVHGTIIECESPSQTKQSGKDNHGVQLAKAAHRNDSVMRTPVKEPSKEKQSTIGGLNCTAIPAPTWSSGDHSIVRENVEPAKMSKMEKPACKKQHLQNLGQITVVEGHMISCNNSSTSKLEGEHCGKEVLDPHLAGENQEMHLAGGNQRQYNVEGQGDPQSTYANNYIVRRVTMHGFHKGTPVPTAHLLPQPFYPQIDALVNGVPGWTWDLNEGVLMSDMENFCGLDTATVDGRRDEITQNVFSSGATDLRGGQVVGDTVYQAAVTPWIQYHTGLEHLQLSPAWHVLAQHDGMHHGGSSGGGVYWPKMEHDGTQAHGTSRTARAVGGVRPVEYQVVEPVASSGVTYDRNQGHPGSNLTVPLRVQIV